MRFCLLAVYLACAGALLGDFTPQWNQPLPPYRVISNLYYVGTNFLASFLITTPDGNILINPDYEESVPLIRKSVEKLGFRFSDTKIILISHAHDDHAAGCALAKRLTGGKLMVMDADVAEIENGGAGDFQYVNSRWPPAKVDRVLHDGDRVTLGGAVLTAHLTPGHTKGCTTWTMEVKENGQLYHVVIVGSPNVNPGYKLVGNAQYPQIAADYERTFRILAVFPVTSSWERMVFITRWTTNSSSFGREVQIRSSIRKAIRPLLGNTNKRFAMSYSHSSNQAGDHC
ncbi:MAG: subclass B3 metallo-beta-lactamase [Acidobacteriaceae bacterium]|nr:subclass B3 metallo-beta-lactamase [Acidobacteriaceae bacterium]